jgi:oligopeptide transport system substrate-binding protein
MIILESGWTKPGVLISNGPFELTLWRFKRDMRFEANPHFWDTESLAIRSIKIPSVEDPNTMVLAFESGAAQWVTDVTAPYRADILAQKHDFYREHAEEYEALKAQGYDQFEIDRRLPDDPRKNVHAVPAFGTYWYNFNCLPTVNGRDNPFADARVRRAFAMAIDKESIVNDVRRTGEPVARTIIPPGSIAGYESPRGLDCISDGKTPQEREAIAARARALLADAGYPNPSEDFPVTVELLFNKAAGHDLIAQAIAKNWERYLGVQTMLKQREIKVFRDDLKNQRYMTGRAGWYGDYGDPTTFLDINRKDDGNNDRKYASDQYESLLERAKNERNPDQRLALLSEAERLIMEEDLPMVPLFHYVTMYLFDPDEITGLNPHPRTTQNVFLIDVLGDGKGPDQPKPMPRLTTRPAGSGT